MKKSMLPLVALLTVLMLVSSTVLASAAKPLSTPNAKENGQTNLSLEEQVTEIKESLPGNGNAWGRIAKELATEKAPGNIAALVQQLKQMAAPGNPDEDNEEEEPPVEFPEISEPVNVTVVDIELDSEGNPTGTITIQFAAAEGEEPQLFTIEVDAELVALIESGASLVLSLNEDGELIISIYEEPAQEEDPEEEPVEEEPTEEEPAEEEPTEEEPGEEDPVEEEPAEEEPAENGDESAEDNGDE